MLEIAKCSDFHHESYFTIFEISEIKLFQKHCWCPTSLHAIGLPVGKTDGRARRCSANWVWWSLKSQYHTFHFVGRMGSCGYESSMNGAVKRKIATFYPFATAIILLMRTTSRYSSEWKLAMQRFSHTLS